MIQVNLAVDDAWYMLILQRIHGYRIVKFEQKHRNVWTFPTLILLYQQTLEEIILLISLIVEFLWQILGLILIRLGWWSA